MKNEKEYLLFIGYRDISGGRDDNKLEERKVAYTYVEIYRRL